MLGLSRTYDSATAFLNGLEMGAGTQLFKGFTGWLIHDLHLPSDIENLAWWAIVARSVCPNSWINTAQRGPAEEENIFNELLALARRYVAEEGLDRTLWQEATVEG